MSKLNLVLAVAVAVALFLLLGGVSLVAPSLAEAHFMLVAPSSWWSQLGDGSPQKVAPCGDEGAPGTAATAAVNVYQPGQPITVTVSATIAHPGWWRISLREGSASTQAASTFPDPTPLGAAGTAQQCTPAFIDNPVWSSTQPVLLDKLGLPAGSTSTDMVQSGSQSFQVTIPATARCTSTSPCTLQVVMFMTDHPAGSCNYHHCADIAAAGVSDGGASGTGGAIGPGAGTGGATATGTDASDAPNGAANSSAGCSCAVCHTAGSSPFVSVLTLAALSVRRRRRSASGGGSRQGRL